MPSGMLPLIFIVVGMHILKKPSQKVSKKFL